MLAISQLLLTRFWSNFKGRFLWTFRTDSTVRLTFVDTTFVLTTFVHIRNKLGLSCAKLRASLSFSIFLFTFIDLTWFGFATLAYEFNMKFGKALFLVSSGSLQDPNKYWARNVFWKLWVWRKFCSEKNLGFAKNFGSKKFRVRKIWAKKNLGSKKNFRPEKILGQQKLLVK